MESLIMMAGCLPRREKESSDVGVQKRTERLGGCVMS